MALQKQITLPNGVTVNYHRIAAIMKTDKKIDITVQSYVTQEYRDLSVWNVVKEFYYSFEDVNIDYSFSSIYELLKTHPDFQDAQNL